MYSEDESESEVDENATDSRLAEFDDEFELRDKGTGQIKRYR
jgi:hypothetical protein